MTINEHDILHSQIAQLPENIRQVVASSDLRPRLKAVADKYQLHVDQAGALEDEVMLILVGLENPKDVTANIKDHVHVSAEVATSLTRDLDEGIFKPIRSSLMQLFPDGSTSEKEVVVQDTNPTSETLSTEDVTVPTFSDSVTTSQQSPITDAASFVSAKLTKQPETPKPNPDNHYGDNSADPYRESIE